MAPSLESPFAPPLCAPAPPIAKSAENCSMPPNNAAAPIGARCGGGAAARACCRIGNAEPPEPPQTGPAGGECAAIVSFLRTIARAAPRAAPRKPMRSGTFSPRHRHIPAGFPSAARLLGISFSSCGGTSGAGGLRQKLGGIRAGGGRVSVSPRRVGLQPGAALCQERCIPEDFVRAARPNPSARG